jgi:hypothetical protein
VNAGRPGCCTVDDGEDFFVLLYLGPLQELVEASGCFLLWERVRKRAWG